MSDELSVFHELGDATRLRVLAAIVRGRKNVSAIVAELGLSQPQVSYHLRRLKDAGLAVEQKDGRWVWYEANHDAPERHLREIIQYVDRWSPDEDASTAGRDGVAVPVSAANRGKAAPTAARRTPRAPRTPERPARREGPAKRERPARREGPAKRERPARRDDEMEDFLL